MVWFLEARKGSSIPAGHFCRVHMCGNRCQALIKFAISRSQSQHKLIQQLMTLCSLPKLQSMSTNKRLEILRKFTEAHLTSPEILRQPDYEQMEWFNDILKLLWPSLCDYTKREIFSKVAPLVKDAAPQLNLRIRSFELGAVPPHITGKVGSLCVERTKVRGSSRRSTAPAEFGPKDHRENASHFNKG